jgi:hypothetical protein
MWRPIAIAIALAMTGLFPPIFWQVEVGPKFEYNVTSNRYLQVERLVLTFSANPMGPLFDPR